MALRQKERGQTHNGVFDPWSSSAREPQGLDHDGRVWGPRTPATELPALWVRGAAQESFVAVWVYVVAGSIT